ncbi:glycerate kinase [Actinomycetes bacterium NPDC127524]
MKIVIAPDSFKESVSASEAARAIRAGFMQIFPEAEYHLLPIADGGEGTIHALAEANNGRMEKISVTGPLGGRVEAKLAYSQDGKKGFIEMAEACGLHLVPVKERNPLHTTSYGVGELMLHAIGQGASELIIGVGGSSTNDGGMGMAAALGFQFFDKDGQELKGTGEDLLKVTSISGKNRDRRLESVKITVAADVENPLTGVDGAAYVYGPQKGLPKEILAELDAAMGRFYNIAGSCIGRDVKFIPGSGAGGGMGAGLLLFANARLQKGIDLVLDQLNMKEVCQNADFVISGEGRMDGQTIFGKAPAGVAKCAPPHTKVIAICGSVGEGAEILYEHGFDAVFPTLPDLMPMEDLLKQAYKNIERTSRNIAALLWKEGTR